MSVCRSYWKDPGEKFIKNLNRNDLENGSAGLRDKWTYYCAVAFPVNWCYPFECSLVCNICLLSKLSEDEVTAVKSVRDI